MRGDYDNSLQWPFEGELLLNFCLTTIVEKR